MYLKWRCACFLKKCKFFDLTDLSTGFIIYGGLFYGLRRNSSIAFSFNFSLQVLHHEMKELYVI